MVLIYAAAGEPLLRAVFGDDLTAASGALPWLGLAMSLLACVYLSVQFLLAMHRRRFIAVLAVAAAAEMLVLLAIGATPHAHRDRPVRDPGGDRGVRADDLAAKEDRGALSDEAGLREDALAAVRRYAAEALAACRVRSGPDDAVLSIDEGTYRRSSST